MSKANKGVVIGSINIVGNDPINATVIPISKNLRCFEFMLAYQFLSMIYL